MSKKKIPVCVYCRVSTAQDSQKLSFNMQKSYYESYVNSNPEWELKHIYADRGISGTILNKNRIEFNKMLYDCGIEVLSDKTEFTVRVLPNEPKYKLIVVKDEKRFSRNSDITTVIRFLRQKGVGVYFETLGINTLENDDITLKILFNMSEEFSKNLSKNLKLSYQRAHLKNDKILGHYAPYGYKFDFNDKGERILVPKSDDYVKIVNDIFDLYIQGWGFRKIGLYVKEKGFRTTNNKEVRKDTIQKILANEKYMGYNQIIIHDEKSVNTFGHTIRQKMNYQLIKSKKIVPMVTEEKFYEARKKLASKPISQSAKKRGINTVRSKYARKVFCLNCGGIYMKTVDTRGDDIYICRNKRENLGSAKNCKSPYVSQSFLDDYLDNLLSNDNFLKVEKEKLEAQIDYFIFYKYALIATFFEDRDLDQIDTLKVKKEALEKEADNLMEYYSEIPKEILTRKLNKIQAEIDILQSSLDKQEFSVSEFKKELSLIDKIVFELRNYNFDKVKTHSDLLKLIDILITPKNPDSPIRQKRNDCFISHRSVYEDELQEKEFYLLKELSLNPNPIYEKRLMEEKYFSEKEKEELDKILSTIF